MATPSQIRIILDRTTHPGNIGAVARAMKVMGLGDLHLVSPKLFPHAEATAMASNADDLLAGARVHRSLDEALADCVLVFGTTARLRSVAQLQMEPRDAAVRITAEAGEPVAVLFGTEKSGLDNDAIARCHYLINIPTGGGYQSLNLAQAVQIMAYEIRLAARATETNRQQPDQGEPGEPEAARKPAPMKRMEVFFRRLEQTLSDIRYGNPHQNRTMNLRLRRLFMRARPDDDELNMLQGILSNASRTARRADDRKETESDR